MIADGGGVFDALRDGVVNADDGVNADHGGVDFGVPSTIDYLKASNTGGGDSFGYSVSLSGDTLAVGAPGEESMATGVGGDETDNGAVGSGAVYVFTRTPTGWSQQAYLKPSTLLANDAFGTSVSLSGDTLAVGAPSTATASGAVSIFVRAGGVWVEEARLVPTGSVYRRRFGQSVSLSGDSLAVAAGKEQTGVVHVYTRIGASWSEQASLEDETPVTGDAFGCALSLSGDTLAVGANQIEGGAVQVFTRTGTTWAMTKRLQPSNTEAGDDFGTSISLWGDTLTLAVGARGEGSSATGVNGDQADNTAPGSGAVYIFRHGEGGWSQQAYLKASNTDAGDQFGYSVSLWGDGVAVGANMEGSNATGLGGDENNNDAKLSGAVYLFTRSGDIWRQEVHVKASNSEADDIFGISVSLSPDGLAVGAHLEDSSAIGVNSDDADNSAEDSGAVYIYTAP